MPGLGDRMSRFGVGVRCDLGVETACDPFGVFIVLAVTPCAVWEGALGGTFSVSGDYVEVTVNAHCQQCAAACYTTPGQTLQTSLWKYMRTAVL